jgi:acetyltransferase-like isoleucine patch superfamily enzyme
MGCHIDGRNGIVFGDNVWVGPRVTIVSMNHDVSNFKIYEECNPVVIGENCWLAANSVILPGVELGPHTIVAAGSVVNKNFPDGDQILAGVPAKVVKKIASYEQ